MTFDLQKLKEILARVNKSVTPEELEMLKKWFEANEKLMDFKNQNSINDCKESNEMFLDLQMDIYDIIKLNDPNYRQ